LLVEIFHSDDGGDSSVVTKAITRHIPEDAILQANVSMKGFLQVEGAD
jgi:hypothetical protein